MAYEVIAGYDNIAPGVPRGRERLIAGQSDSLDADNLGLINVKAYGAVGDGVTDDTAAWAAAITAAAGKQLVVPAGTYKLTNNVTVPSGVVLVLQRGATVTVSVGKTLTISGPLFASDNMATLFAGAGTTTISTTDPAIVSGRTTFMGLQIFDTDVMIGRDLTVGRNQIGLLSGVCQGRLTLTAGTPVTTADVSGPGASSVYWTPYGGNSIALYDGAANWTVLPFVETTLALGTVTNDLPYDVFAYNNNGTLALEKLAWTSKTARATALVLQDGVLSKSGALTRRYLGSFHTASTTTTEDSAVKRFLWNYYNRVSRRLFVQDATASWTYTTATFRQANGSAANQVEMVVGWAESPIHLDLAAAVTNSAGNVLVAVGIGEDSTTTPLASLGGIAATFGSASLAVGLRTAIDRVPAVGYHKYCWLEWSNAMNITTWFSALSSLVTGVGSSALQGTAWG